MIRSNINEYLRFCDPQLPPSSGRHSATSQWSADNPHLPQVGSFQWGLWQEQGNPQRGPTISKDTVVGGRVRSVPILRDLLRSLANITRAVNILFGATDHKTRDAYLEKFAKIPLRYRNFFSTDGDGDTAYLGSGSDLFSLRVLLINLWTQPHRDSKDWDGGWAWLAVLGTFSGGDFCITELQRRIPFPSGAILGLKGGALEHWTTKWNGQARYCLVHVFHEFIRTWPFSEALKNVS